MKRRKERLKVLGALKASLRTGDLVAAGHYQRIVDEYFCAEVNAADPAVVSDSESEGAAAGRPDSDALATEERGEAGPGDNTDSEVGESDVTQSSRDTPKAHSTVSVHTEAHGVTFDFGQRNPDDDASGDARPALDFDTVFRSP